MWRQRGEIPGSAAWGACPTSRCDVTAMKSRFPKTSVVYTFGSRDSIVSMVTRYGLDGPGIESRWGARYSAPVQTGSEAQPASYTMGTRVFPGGKVAGAWRWPPTPSSSEVKERVELYLYSPSRSSWPVPANTFFTCNSTCDTVIIEYKFPCKLKFSHTSFSAISETLSYSLATFLHVRNSLKLIIEAPKDLVKSVRIKKLTPGTKLWKTELKSLYIHLKPSTP